MIRKQNDVRGDPRNLTGFVVLFLVVLFFVIFFLFLVAVINFLRSPSPSPSTNNSSLVLETETFIPTPTSLIVLPTEIPTEIPTLIPTEIPTEFPTEVMLPTSTPESLIPVTGADLNEVQASALLQMTQIGLGVLALSLILVGVILRSKNK